MSLLDNAIKTYLTESREGPGDASVSNFEENVQDELADKVSGVGKNSKRNSLDISGDVTPELEDKLESVLSDYISDNFSDVEVVHPPQVSRSIPTATDPKDKEEKSWNQIDSYQTISDHKSSNPILYVVLGENNEVYGWKLSSSASSSGLRASQYELLICTAYNLYKDRNNSENPLVVEGGSFETSRQQVSRLSEEDIEPYVTEALGGSSDQGKVELALNTEGLMVSLDVIMRNPSLQNRGDYAVQYGSASAGTSSEYTGGDATPKTDFYFEDGTNVSLKKKGSSAQYMSGEKDDARAVFEAAKYFFDAEEDSAKEEVLNELIETVKKRFDDRINRTGEDNVTDIKKTVQAIYIDDRVGEIGRKLESDIRKGGRKVELEMKDGEDIVFTNESSQDIKTYLQKHAENELKYYGLKRGNPDQGEIISKYMISGRKLIEKITKEFKNEKIDELDEMAKQVVRQAVDNEQASRVIKQQVLGSTKTSERLRKWILFEASTGLYKFDGPVSSDPFQALDSSSRPVADTILKFDPTVNGNDILTKVNESWVNKNAQNVNIRVSFKTRSSSIAQTLRLENVSDAFSKAAHEERQKMFEDMAKHVKHRKSLFKAREEVEKQQTLMSEEIFGYDFGGMIKNAIKDGVSIVKYIKNRFTEYLQDTYQKITDLIRKAGNQGLGRLMNLFGVEVDQVEIDIDA